MDFLRLLAWNIRKMLKVSFSQDIHSIVTWADFNAVHISFTITLLTTPTWFIPLTFLIRSVSALPYFNEWNFSYKLLSINCTISCPLYLTPVILYLPKPCWRPFQLLQWGNHTHDWLWLENRTSHQGPHIPQDRNMTEVEWGVEHWFGEKDDLRGRSIFGII